VLKGQSIDGTVADGLVAADQAAATILSRLGSDVASVSAMTLEQKVEALRAARSDARDVSDALAEAADALAYAIEQQASGGRGHNVSRRVEESTDVLASALKTIEAHEGS
jgi:succinate dehydrogenase/fumarate reductase flavoprotein subunit